MEGFSKKEYLSLKMPTEEIPASDHRRIELALNTLGYAPVTFPLKVLRKLYPLCRNAGFDITVTLVHREYDWVVTDVEAGDTTMIHFLLGLDAWTVFASPYAPVTMDPGFLWGEELGMVFEGLVYMIPAASNYVGGDIVSGLMKLEIHKENETKMFFDIGTNGELVIGSKDWMIAGAGAAGPALEGYISKFDMRAAPGAVDSVRIKGQDLSFTTVDRQNPAGICGSGIIDLLAQMRLPGWIDIAGSLQPGASARIGYFPEEKEYAAVYATAEESAITVGIFPDLPRENYSVLRNSSLDGARTVLLDRSRLAEAKSLAENIYCIQFASIPDFLIRMQAAKFIPHTDSALFPSVRV